MTPKDILEGAEFYLKGTTLFERTYEMQLRTRSEVSMGVKPNSNLRDIDSKAKQIAGKNLVNYIFEDILEDIHTVVRDIPHTSPEETSSRLHHILHKYRV